MAAQPPPPELRQFFSFLTLRHLEKMVRVKLNGDRVAFGILVGYDHFMNLSLRNAEIITPPNETIHVDSCILRGATVLSFEANNTG